MVTDVNGHVHFYRVSCPCACYCEIRGQAEGTGCYVEVLAKLCCDVNCGGRAKLKAVCDHIQAGGGTIHYSTRSGRRLN